MAFDKKDFGIAAGGALAFLLGWRRLAGVIWGIGGMYEWSRGQKVGGAFAMLGGASFTFFPDWPGSLFDALKGSPSLPQSNVTVNLPPPQRVDIPTYQKVSFPSLDRDLGGDWHVLDVRDIRDKSTAAAAQSLKPGQIASLVLQNKNGPYMVFLARVIGGGNGLLYAGQWATQPPAGGPQLIDFGPEHVFTAR